MENFLLQIRAQKLFKAVGATKENTKQNKKAKKNRKIVGDEEEEEEEELHSYWHTLSLDTTLLFEDYQIPSGAEQQARCEL